MSEKNPITPAGTKEIMKTVLFVCTHNSSRSQMAEGLVNHYYSEDYLAFSAGTQQTGVHPLAVRAMELLNVDISHHRSQHIDDFMDRSFDLVITVCDSARETCPYFPNAEKHQHISLIDPSAVEGTEEERLQAYVRTRDQLRAVLPKLLDV